MGDGITSANYFNDVLFNDYLGDVSNYDFVRCFQTEDDYNALRKNMPPYLTDAASSIDLTESASLCSYTYPFDSAMQALCEQTYNQLLMRGLTSTIYSIYNYMQSLAVQYN